MKGEEVGDIPLLAEAFARQIAFRIAKTEAIQAVIESGWYARTWTCDLCEWEGKNIYKDFDPACPRCGAAVEHLHGELK